MQDLIDMSKSLKVCIFALLHVRDGLEITETSSQIKKLIRTGKAEDIFEESVTFIRKPSISDIYGGAGKTQVSGILILWRPYQEFSHVQYSCMTMLILAQMRKSGSGNNIEMRYYGESGVFKEIEPPSPTTKQAVEIFTNN